MIIKHRELTVQASFYRYISSGLIFLMSLSLWGCVSTQPTAEEDADMGCVSGDCHSGYGVFKQQDGKYVRESEGTFKDGKLWEGKVNLTMANMDKLLIEEISAGKIIWKRAYGH